MNVSSYLMLCHYTEKSSCFFCSISRGGNPEQANLLDNEQKQTCHDNGENLPWENKMATVVAVA